MLAGTEQGSLRLRAWLGNSLRHKLPENQCWLNSNSFDLGNSFKFAVSGLERGLSSYEHLLLQKNRV